MCGPNASGEELIRNYFFCHSVGNQKIANLDLVPWEVLRSRLQSVTPVLATSVGYFPIFETASALCVSQLLDPEFSDEPTWEVEKVVERLSKASKSSPPKVRLAIDRHSKIYAFKVI